MEAVRSKPIKIKRGMRAFEVCRWHGAREAFEEIFHTCLWHAGLNADLIRIDNPEGVHQTRIGIRRARSALALFKPLLATKPRKTAYQNLREVGQRFAPARDWDVFRLETLPQLTKRFPELAYAQLTAAVEYKRQLAYARLDNNKRGLPSSPIVFKVDKAETPIEAIAPDLLDRQYFLVRRAFRHIDTPEQRHTLRKAMKKLRYSIEFLRGLYERKAVDAFLHHCREAQEVLGKMNDAQTMIDLLSELTEPDGLLTEASRAATDQALTWARHQQDKADDHLAGTLAGFRGAKPFWD